MSLSLKTFFTTLLWLFALLAAQEVWAFNGTFFLTQEREPFGRITHHVIASDEETLVELAVREGLGYNEIVSANPGINPWYPGKGTRVLVPTAWILPELFPIVVEALEEDAENPYTVQVASYEHLSGALKNFDSLADELSEEERDFLRIERAGEVYRVRIGQFPDYASAERLLTGIPESDQKPLIIKASIRPESIIASLPSRNRTGLHDIKGGTILINLAELRLYHVANRDNGLSVTTFPIGIAREGLETPMGEYSIVEKLENPSWTVPKSIRMESPELPAVVPPGPDNPLGTHALRLSNPSYLIHGTNKPLGVGRKVSHGCIRMYPEDIKILYALARVGDTVRIVSQPIKVGVKNESPYIEVHESDDISRENTLNALSILTAAGLEQDVDMDLLTEAVMKKSGVPVRLRELGTGS